MPDIDTTNHETQDEYFGRSNSTPSYTPPKPVVVERPKTTQEHVVSVYTEEQVASSVAANLFQHFSRVLEGYKARVRSLSGQYLVEVEVNNVDSVTLQRVFDAVRFYNIGRESRDHF